MFKSLFNNLSQALAPEPESESAQFINKISTRNHKKTMKTIDIKINDILFTVTYQYIPEVKGVFDKAPENCYDNEPAELYINSIYLPSCNQDLIDFLSEEILNKIDDKIIEFETK